MRFSLRTLLILLLVAPLAIYRAWELREIVGVPLVVLTFLTVPIALTIGAISAVWWLRSRYRS